MCQTAEPPVQLDRPGATRPPQSSGPTGTTRTEQLAEKTDEMIVAETTRRNEALNTKPTRSKRIHSAISTRIIQVLAVGCPRQIQLNRALFDGPIGCIPNTTFKVILKRGGTLVTRMSVVKQMEDLAGSFALDHKIVC